MVAETLNDDDDDDDEVSYVNSSVRLIYSYLYKHWQEVQLSHRDRATAAWAKFGQAWKTIFCRHYRSIFNHCDVIGLQSYQIHWNNAK